ncbi:23S rRNA (uracil(1939)-C(5))-methyltransferase RlmD [Acholeplasma granularum]|uniref:23S rRNA (uracil(1939)-C(5))-methyltransferase RlmD n=1 Tax=Acholeplasma granularum TaxID=264635 RepID=UPI00046E673D|nr:23S rRNA (uracil(1939)-C(5))-methyltransferase RlmD [Acholeplasma granularum]
MSRDYNDQHIFENHETTKYDQMPYQQQLKSKQDFIETLFKKKADPIIKNDRPRGYRHKAVLSATNINVNNNQQIRLGLFLEGTKHIKPKLGHFLHDKDIDNIFISIEKLLIKYKFKAYARNYRNGIIKHVMIRKSFAFNTFQVVIVTQNSTFPNHKLFIRELLELHPEIESIVQNIHRKDTKFVLLDEERILYKNGFIFDKIGDLTFKISANAFYQINPVQMFNLYEKVFEFADIKKEDIVLDCYSGIGTMSLIASSYAKTVYGLEINPSSHKDAIDNKNLNKITNVNFILGDVEKSITDFKEDVDVLIMDPTRDGASLSFIQSIIKIKPKKIVYVSCDPMTQERDYKQLRNHYTLRKIQPVDMFSYTPHVENIIMLELK